MNLLFPFENRCSHYVNPKIKNNLLKTVLIIVELEIGYFLRVLKFWLNETEGLHEFNPYDNEDKLGLHNTAFMRFDYPLDLKNCNLRVKLDNWWARLLKTNT